MATVRLTYIRGHWVRVKGCGVLVWVEPYMFGSNPVWTSSCAAGSWDPQLSLVDSPRPSPDGSNGSNDHNHASVKTAINSGGGGHGRDRAFRVRRTRMVQRR